MEDVNLYRTEMIAANGETIRLVYEQDKDILEVFFGQNEPATGVELTDHIVLRLNQHTGRAVSLTMLQLTRLRHP